MTPERAHLLASLFAQYPELQTYRDLTLRVGSIYRLPLPEVADQIIGDLPYRDDFGPKLKTSIATLKQARPAILWFREFFQQHPDLPKKCRANAEYLNQKFKAVFRSGLFLKGWARAESELQLQLGGEVRNFLSAV